MSIARDVHVGRPKPSKPLEESINVHFHDFVNLPCEKGKKVESPTFICAGHEWFLGLYPGGHSEAKNGMVSVFLGSKSKDKIMVDFDITVQQFDVDFVKRTDKDIKFPSKKYLTWGWHDYEERKEIVKTSNGVLKSGTLTFIIHVKSHSGYSCHNVKPLTTLAENIFSLLQNEESTDVAFEVDGRLIYAHKLILKAQAPELAELAEPYDKTKPIPIKDVDPKIFQKMLEFVYGKFISADIWEQHAKQILDASEKYGFTELKHEAEVWQVNNFKHHMSVENVIDELLFADGKNFALLKKVAMDFIMAHGEEVLESDSYEKLDESPKLRREVMKAFAARGTSNK